MYQNLIQKINNQYRNLQLAKFDLTHRKSSIQLFQKIDIIDKNGHLIKENKFKPAHSFTVAFLQYLGYCMEHSWTGTPTAVTIKDYSNSSESISYASDTISTMWAFKSPSGTTTYGILAGTGTNTPTNSDYAMQTLIAHGTSSGQLSYGATVAGAGSLAGSNVDLIHQRTLTNGSGSSITVREIGMVISFKNVSQAQKYFLIARDAVNQAIANGSSAVISYLLRTTV